MKFFECTNHHVAKPNEVKNIMTKKIIKGKNFTLNSHKNDEIFQKLLDLKETKKLFKHKQFFIAYSKKVRNIYRNTHKKFTTLHTHARDKMKVFQTFFWYYLEN